jgi:signal transduction histidine kinase
LALLKQYPLDAIKADLSFVAGLPDSPEDVAILEAMMGVAKALGLYVVAEGVEDARQLAELQRLGCLFGQGYLWSPAVDGDLFLEEVQAPVTIVAPDGSPVAVRAADGRGPSAQSRLLEDDLDVVFRSLAHEIRTPLTVVMGYASLLESSVDPADRPMATSIRSDVERFDLDRVVEALVGDLSPVFSRPITVEVPGGEPVPVEADRSRVDQILTNLVSNAVKFSPGGTAVSVIVSATVDDVEVSVADEGPGIDPADIGLVYRKYARIDRTRSGSGLGLYLARGMARAHGGDVTYRRRSDAGGSVFTVRLPRSEE